MIVGAAIVPAAPVLVPGVSPTLPEGVQKVRDAAAGALRRLPDADAAVLITAGDKAVHVADKASLAGVGRANIVRDVSICHGALPGLTSALQYPVSRDMALPLELGVLALLWPDPPPLIPLTVPVTASFDTLVAAGAAIAEAVQDVDLTAVVVASGDLSAGLTAKSPLHEVSGALFFDEQAAASVDSGRLHGLGRIGPEEAARVGARGWAPMSVLHGAVARAKIGMVVRHYSAPRGVGYLVASG